MGWGAGGKETLPEVAWNSPEWRQSNADPRRTASGRGNSRGKGPEVGTCPVCGRSLGVVEQLSKYLLNEHMKDQINDPSVLLGRELGEDRRRPSPSPSKSPLPSPPLPQEAWASPELSPQLCFLRSSYEGPGPPFSQGDSISKVRGLSIVGALGLLLF